MSVCAVVVPVMRRPHRVQPLVESLVESGADARLVFVADHDDTAQLEAIQAAGADLVVNFDERRSFAVKANLGYRSTTEPWLLFCGDDVVFCPGWLEAALSAAGEHFHLVATNDLLNGAVMVGRHATHPLIRRSWIDSHGASWDGPGVVAHEGYGHWFVDNEWSMVALQAGVFRFAPAAVVEHRHHLNGGAEHDEVYRHGEVTSATDSALFNERARRHGGHS
jgi:glycosyltransferase involved in cell wall biosynthesis